jgi:streptogramin lyase
MRAPYSIAFATTLLLFTADARADLVLSAIFGGNGEFSSSAIGVALDSSGNVFVADQSTNVYRFNPSNFSGTLTTFGLGPSGGSGSQGIAVDGSGYVYVGEATNNRVDRFLQSNPSGTFTSFGGQPVGSGVGQFNGPYSVAVDKSGLVYVADVGNSRIVRFNPANFQGTFQTFGSFGAGNGQFKSPNGVAVDAAGQVYVADTSNARIVRFDPSNFAGTFASFGSYGHNSLQFDTPYRVAVDGKGLVYVADYANNRFDRFDPSNFSNSFASFGEVWTGNGTRPFLPADIAVNDAGSIVYVADYQNARIVQFTTASVPEPSSILLGGLAAGGAWLSCRRRLKARATAFQ